MHFSPVHRALAILGACAALAFPQTRTPGEQAPASGVIRVDVELVNLLSTVQDRTLKEAVRSTLGADAIFFGIDPKDQPGVAMDILRQLSSQMGGSAFHIDKHTTLEAALRAIEEQLRNQYAIGYAAPENSKKGTFHKVEGRVKKPGFTVRIRSGYFR